MKPLGYGCIDEVASCSWLMTHEEGWNKVLQCIKVRKDKGVVIYDDRYHLLMIKFSYFWGKFSLLISKKFSFFTKSSLELIRDSKNYSSHLTGHILLFPRIEFCSPYPALNVCVSIHIYTLLLSLNTPTFHSLSTFIIVVSLFLFHLYLINVVITSLGITNYFQLTLKPTCPTHVLHEFSTPQQGIETLMIWPYSIYYHP